MSWQSIVQSQPFAQRIWLDTCRVQHIQTVHYMVDVAVFIDKDHYEPTRYDLMRLKLLRQLCGEYFQKSIRHLQIVKDNLAFQALSDHNARVIDVSPDS